MERYRIQLFKDGKHEFMNITLSKEKGSEFGDRFVRAICEITDFCEEESDIIAYSEPMDMGEIKKYVEQRIFYVRGPEKGRCMGICLEDKNDRKIYFQKPIPKK